MKWNKNPKFYQAIVILMILFVVLSIITYLTTTHESYFLLNITFIFIYFILSIIACIWIDMH